MSSVRAESHRSAGWRRWGSDMARMAGVPVAIASLLLFSACDESGVLSPSSSGFEPIGQTADVHGPEEHLYLTDSGSQTPDGEGTLLFRVDLDDGTSKANLTQLFDMPAPNFDQVDAIAASSDGLFVWAVDKVSSHLGVYDVVAGTFSDEGEIAGLPEGTVLAATSPSDVLWVANQANNNVYTIDTTVPSATLVGTMSGTSFLGADLVFTAGGDLFFWTNDDTPEARGFYSLHQGTLVASYLGPETQPEPGVTVDWFVTGLAIRDVGEGEIVGSTNEDEVRVIDATNGATLGTFAMMLGGAPYEYEFGDMTVGQIVPEEEGCTLTQGYWKTHNDSFKGLGGPPSDPTWDLLGLDAEETEFFDSGLSYFEVLTTDAEGNKAMILAHQYIAAELNVLAGASMPSDVQDAFDDATVWFTENATGGSFPVVEGGGAVATMLVEWSELLDSYNNGLEGVPHCDTLEEE